MLPSKHLQSNRHLIGFLLLGCVTLGGTAQAAEKLLFRYVDENKHVVLNDTLPPSAVNNGYEIIRPDGTVIKTVQPAAADAAAAKAAAEAERLAEEADRQRKWDESLLLRYSDVADIKAAKKRALSDIQVRLSILRGNLNYLKTQVEREEFRAAEADRQGLEVSAEQKDAIRTMKAQLGDVEELIEVRAREMNEVAARYDRDIQRFDVLLKQIGSRR